MTATECLPSSTVAVQRVPRSTATPRPVLRDAAGDAVEGATGTHTIKASASAALTLDAGSGLACVLDVVPPSVAIDHYAALLRSFEPMVRRRRIEPSVASACLTPDCPATVASPSSTLCSEHDADARVWLTHVGREGRAYERGLLGITIGRPRARSRSLEAARNKSGRRAVGEWEPVPDAHVFVSVPAWQAHAACVGADARLFFPDRETKETTAEAKAFCARCSVRASCLLDALAGIPHPYDSVRLETPGVAGGMTTVERRALGKTDLAAA